MSKKKDIPIKTAVTKSTFVQAVDSTPDVAGKSKKGLSALGGNSTKIKVTDARKVDGSLDIDCSVKKLYPEESRWDYGVSYNGKVYFVEVHPAMTNEVETVLKKLAWLKQWLKNQAPEISRLKADDPFHWIQTANNLILPKTSQYRKLAESKLLPKKQLILS